MRERGGGSYIIVLCPYHLLNSRASTEDETFLFVIGMGFKVNGQSGFVTKR